MTKASDNPYPSLLVQEAATDGSDFANPDADYRRLFLGEDGLLHLKDSAGAVTDIGGSAVADILDLPTAETDDALVLAPDGAGGVEFRAEAGGGGGAGGPLAVIAYATGSDAVVGATTSSTTLVDVDATNAAITFTAPASGNVLVVLDGLQSGTNASMVKWGVREATTILGGANIGASSGNGNRNHAEIYITGVSAGSHTYKWAHAIASGTVGLYAGPNTGHGKIVMAVYACP